MKENQSMTKFKRIDDGVVKVSRVTSYLSAVLMSVICVIVVIDVVLSKLGMKSITDAYYIVQYSIVPVVYVSVSYAQLKSEHVRVDIIYAHYPAWLKKTINIVGDVLGAAVISGMAYYVLRYTVKLMGTKERLTSTNVHSLQKWPFAALMAIGLALFALACVWCVVRMILRHGEDTQKADANP